MLKAYRLTYGFDPLTWILIGALVNIIVRIILEWIYGDTEQERTERSNLMWKFRRELEGNGGWSSGDH